MIPLLIHLFSRRRVKVVEFSSLKHLKDMQKRQVRRLKIRQLLLLILRMLIILTAVLAFARPASKGGYIGSHAGVSSVILLDKSASMQREVKDGHLFDLAGKAADDILSNFGESDEIILIPFDMTGLFPAGERFFSRDIAENILNEVKAGYHAGNLEAAYNKSLELLAGAKNLNKELYIISDRQVSSLPENIDTAEEKISAYFVDLPVETDGNCGLTGVDLGGQLIEIGSSFNIKADIENFDNFDKSELLASLFIDGIRVMQTEYAIDARGTKTVQFTHTVFNPGFHYGRVELSDDAFLPDNKYFFSFSVPETFNVLIIDGDDFGELIRLALVPSEKLARYWSVKIASPDKLAGLRMRDYDVIIASGISSLGGAETARILKYVDDGGGLFFVAGSGIDVEYFNNYLTGIVNLSFEEPPPSFFSGAGYYSLERFDFSHPVFKAFEDFKNDSLPTLRFYALPKITDRGANSELAYFSNNDPAIVESSYGLGKIIVMTSCIDPRYTDLASHSFFVPFIIRTTEYLAGAVSEYELKNYVGKNIFRALPGRKTGFSMVQMIAPDGKSYNISGSENDGQMIYECRPIEQPGIYQIKSQNRLVDLFPVNTPLSESDLSFVDFNRLEKVLKLDDARTIPYGQSAGSIISEARFGRELWKIFLWAVVVLMAVEMIFSRESGPDVEES